MNIRLCFTLVIILNVILITKPVDANVFNYDIQTGPINNVINSLKDKKIRISVENDIVECDLNDLELTYDTDIILKKSKLLAFSNQLTEIMKKDDGLFFLPFLRKKHEKVVINATINQEKLENFLRTNLKKYNYSAKNSTAKLQNGKFIYQEEKFGQAIILNETIKKINDNLMNWNGENIDIKASVTKIVPTVTMYELKKSNDKLGEYSTSFISTSERTNNLKNGVSFINGYILQPGQIFSAYEVLSPFSIANGYESASVFSNRDIVQSIAGGICQVTTTLYNAVLMAELEIIERHEHSIQVSYVEASRDATVSTKYKDFRFKNNTNSLIYIFGIVENGIIKFTLYGQETRDTTNRKIEFEVEIKRYMAPDIVQKDINSTNKEKRNSRYGCEAELYKVVHIKGKEVERELINSSTYSPLAVINDE